MVTLRQRQAIDFCESYGFPKFFDFCRDNKFPNPYDYEYAAVSAYLGAHLNSAKIKYCQENFCPKFDPKQQTPTQYVNAHYDRARAIAKARKVYFWASRGYNVPEPNWETLTTERAKRFSGAYRIEAEQMHSEIMASIPDPWYD